MTEVKKSAKKSTPTHPPAMDMIKGALTASHDKKGLSLALIKKYIAQTYNVNLEKYGPFLRRALGHGVDKGHLVRVGNKGKGASGSFKLPSKDSGKEATKHTEKKPSHKKLTKKTVTKKHSPKKVTKKAVEKKPVEKKEEKKIDEKPKKVAAEKPIKKSPVKRPAFKPKTVTPKKVPKLGAKTKSVKPKAKPKAKAAIKKAAKK